MTPYPGAMSVAPGTMTPGFATSSRIDLNQIGEARNSMLGIKLDQVILQSFVDLLFLRPQEERATAYSIVPLSLQPDLRFCVWTNCGGPQGLSD